MNRPGANSLFRRHVKVALLFVLAFGLITSTAIACPTCKDGLTEGSPAQQAMVNGYFYSILFMMAMPFLLVFSFGSLAWFSIRKARTQQQLAE